jgi:hypothetical protein
MTIKTVTMSNDALFDRKVEELKACADKARISKWGLVDKLLECEDLLGDRFSQAVEVTRLSPGALSNYLSTGRAWPPVLRHLDMPFDSHTALNPLSDDQKTAVMLMAKKSGWNRDDLRLRVAAHKAGDKLAFDPRHKVEAPAPRPRKVVDVEELHARVKNDNDSKEEKPVFDTTDAGADFRAANRAEAIEARADHSKSTATERLNHALATLKAMRTDPGFMAALDPTLISADACGLEGQWLINVGTETRHRQNIEFERAVRKPASKKSQQGREAASRLVHTQEIVGASPAPATNPDSAVEEDIPEFLRQPAG